MNWLLIYQIAYIAVIVLVCLRIVYDTDSTAKTLAYLLLVIFLPIAGVVIYFSVGVNYRKRQLYSKKLLHDAAMVRQLRAKVYRDSRQAFEQSGPAVQRNKELALLLLHNSGSPIAPNNAVKLLVNGENKFAEVLQALRQARHHIHLEYYIYEDDEIGRAVAEVLMQKVAEGVVVRFIYDDFGSRSIRHHLVPRLRAAGVEAFPFYKITFIALANRLNYRNHRKIIVIDGQTAFTGGINVSDKYINTIGGPDKVFWRDTHLRLDGPGVHYLQYLFLCDWNFCANDSIQPDERLFPPKEALPVFGDKVVQIAGGGPDSATPVILFSLLQAINLATQEILITTPYFIPGDSLLYALRMAALSGVSVKLLVPDHSDSVLVNSAARAYYDELLQAGVEIYRYTKGFVHAKTVVTDGQLSVVGTANMDFRSFDLNFEVNAIVYDEAVAGQLRDLFFEDLRHARQIDPAAWNSRPKYKKLWEKTARLVSPLL